MKIKEINETFNNIYRNWYCQRNEKRRRPIFHL